MSDTNETKKPAAVRQVRTGKVASTGGDKTIHVVVESKVKHPQYGKYARRRRKIAVHDPADKAGLGDVVEIVPCRRLSKSKSWRLLRVVRTSASNIQISVDKG